MFSVAAIVLFVLVAIMGIKDDPICRNAKSGQKVKLRPTPSVSAVDRPATLRVTTGN